TSEGQYFYFMEGEFSEGSELLRFSKANNFSTLHTGTRLVLFFSTSKPSKKQYTRGTTDEAPSVRFSLARQSNPTGSLGNGNSSPAIAAKDDEKKDGEIRITECQRRGS